MGKETSPWIVGDYWLDKRRDGKSPEIWQIARSERGTIIYRSTRKRELEAAKAELNAYVDMQKAKRRQDASAALIAPMLFTYWNEVGKDLINNDQTARSIRTFLAFLMQDEAGVQAVATDMTPMLFERFRKWRMGRHGFEGLIWFGQTFDYASEGVAGSTVQRNINDIRAAIYHAEKNHRLTSAPAIGDVDQKFKSANKSRILTDQEMGRIAWYCYHFPDMFRFVALQIATSVRPMAALKFDPARQYDERSGMIDLQPGMAPQTKKRNAIIPAIRPMRPVLRAWAREGADQVGSRKTAWRKMRKVLGLSGDVEPKTIRYTVATWLYEMEWVPERQISEMLGHVVEDNRGLARTSKIYAKYRAERMGKVVAGLTMIWMRISREARRYASDHILTTGENGRRIIAPSDLPIHDQKARITKHFSHGGRDRD